jgi:hypothetical protein
MGRGDCWVGKVEPTNVLLGRMAVDLCELLFVKGMVGSICDATSRRSIIYIRSGIESRY